MASTDNAPMANSQQDSFVDQSAVHDHSSGGIPEGKSEAPAGRALLGFTVQPGGGSIAPAEYEIAASMLEVKEKISVKLDCEPQHVVLRLAGMSSCGLRKLSICLHALGCRNRRAGGSHAVRMWRSCW